MLRALSAGWRQSVAAALMSGVLGTAGPVAAETIAAGDWEFRVGGAADGDWRSCIFGYRFGLDLLVPGYNPGPVPAYCPPPIAYYPMPPVAAPTAPLYLASPSRSTCALRSAGIAGDRVSSVLDSLCRDDSALWAQMR
jgi:hypothetical protein